MPKTFAFLFIAVFSAASGLYGEDLPDYFIQLRDALYSQVLSSADLSALYTTAEDQANKQLSGADLPLMLSRCEYIMGRCYLYEKNKSQADQYLQKGLDYAQKSLDQQPTSEGWRMLAENLSQLCTVRSTGWVMRNGLSVEKYSKNALNIDPGNTAAQYMIAARYVYAPAPFHNYSKGLQMMKDILANYDNRLSKDDRFNVNLSIGYTLIQQNKNTDAKDWLQKALAIYPDNKYVKSLLAGL